jgi:WD40 repeat protein
MAAHDSEILSLAYSPPREKKGPLGFGSIGGEALLLASASSDRLVHVFRADEGYDLKQTLATHNSTVSSVRFSVFGDRLLSCGGKAIALSHVHDDAVVKPYKTVMVSSGTQYDVAVEPTNKYMVSAGRDKRLNIFNLGNGKHLR